MRRDMINSTTVRAAMKVRMKPNSARRASWVDTAATVSAGTCSVAAAASADTASVGFGRSLTCLCLAGAGLRVQTRVLGADRFLVQLADAGLREAGHEENPIRQLPALERSREMLDELLGRRGPSRLEHHQRQWPLLPSRMGYADDHGLADRRMADQRVLHIDG